MRYEERGPSVNSGRRMFPVSCPTIRPGQAVDRQPCRRGSTQGGVRIVADESASVGHVTVDAGAQMFPAMALLPAHTPSRILISNGLSTMGYALPAAIGAALLEPRDPVVAITGDGGLLMTLGELRTAAREGVRVIVIVLADGELSLIRIKQDRRGLAPDGVRIGDLDWPGVASALGLRSYRASDAATLRRHLITALAGNGPALIETRIDPSGYGSMLEPLRG
jgi:acetolactate synthase I/II/III large subunit